MSYPDYSKASEAVPKLLIWGNCSVIKIYCFLLAKFRTIYPEATDNQYKYNPP
jgi:hypothetical protein